MYALKVKCHKDKTRKCDPCPIKQSVTLLFAVQGFEDNCVNDCRRKYSRKGCLEQRVLSLYSTLTQRAERRVQPIRLRTAGSGKWGSSP